MEFRTKLDFSTRQIKQNPETFSVLSGGTAFGLPFSALTTGPDLTTTAITATYTTITSTFSGNSATTVYNWYNPSMNLGASGLSAITPSNTAITQNTVVFTSNTTTTIDGNVVTLTYTGVSYDVKPTVFVNLGSGNYSGSVLTNQLLLLSAGTLDYTGRTIWVDVSGITRTQRLIISNVGAGPGTIDIGVDANGFVVDQASDINLKENINTIDNALNKVLGLRGVTYNWKDRQRGGDNLKMGFIAQEVKDVVPELAYYSVNGEYMGVYYKDVPALLVEAIKELATGNIVTTVTPTVKTQVTNVDLHTQTIVAEDNNIELNYNGSRETSVGGGLIVLHAKGNDINSTLITNNEGNWTTNCDFEPKGLKIPLYTPTSSLDVTGSIGSVSCDDDFIYIKTNNGWKRTKLESF